MIQLERLWSIIYCDVLGDCRINFCIYLDNGKKIYKIQYPDMGIEKEVTKEEGNKIFKEKLEKGRLVKILG